MSIRYSPRQINEPGTPRKTPHDWAEVPIGMTASWAEASARVVETLERPTLPGNLTQCLSTLIKFAQCKMMVFSRENRPVLVHDSHPKPDTQDGVANYIDRSYLINPFYRMYLSGASAGVHRLGDLRHFGVTSIEYTEYPVQPVASEEIGYLTEGLPGGLEELCIGLDLPGGDRALLGLTRDRSTIGFSTAEMDLASAVTPFLAAVFRRYWLRSRPFCPALSSTRAFNDGAANGLSPREQEVVQLIIRGHSSPSIALNLNISLTTVKTHRKNIYSKLRIASQCELFSRAVIGNVAL